MLKQCGGCEISIRPFVEHNGVMGVLYYIVDTFIDTFGITRPSQNARKQAAFFIMALLLLAVAGAAIAFLVLRTYMK
jgi:hypothetical protein